tara:strand:- start:13362 stop:14972 length:1611 start_codon:yes stop_codon:yes gene_type:complete
VDIKTLDYDKLKHLPDEEQLAIADKVAALVDCEINTKIDFLKEENAYYYFEPSDGTVTPEGEALLRKYLNPEDIPQVFDSQLDAIKALETCNIIAVLGANQAGKTLIMSIICYGITTGVLPEALKGVFPEHLLPKRFPMKARVVGVDNRQLQNAVIREWKKFAPKECLKNGNWADSWNAERKMLTLYRDNNFVLAEIEFMTNEQDVDSFQGVQLNVVIYDEEPKEKIRKENLMRFVTADRVIELFGFTPTHGLSWSSEIFFGDIADNVKVFELASVTNKKANLSTLDEICSQETDYNKLLMRLLGKYVSLSGLVYSNLFSEKIHVIKPFKLNREDYIVYRGLDPHMTKPTACAEIAVDREGFEYVVGCYKSNHGDDTEIIKAELAKRAIERNYRLGWTNCDKSADSTIRIIGDYNAYVLLGRGKNAIPALFKSEKFVGSKIAGVDLIRQKLKVDERINLPKLVIFDTPENKELIHSMKTLERDTFANEDDKIKDDIKEGKHDFHAALRYAHQRVMNWMPFNDYVPEPEYDSDNTGY